jgi:uncharacterized protein (DUF2062 family)
LTVAEPHTDAQPAIRICAVIPACDNPKTIGEVVEGAKRHVEAVIVVDDASGEEGRAAIDGVAGIDLVRHETNLGTGAALASGFARAIELGYTHAITIAADGRHASDELARFVAAIAEDPAALHVGTRERRDRGDSRASRMANRLSNICVWVETGVRLADTQCAMRAYPLGLVADLRVRASRHAYAAEALVKASWAGAALKAMPVSVRREYRCASQIRPARDFFRLAILNSRLIAVRLLLPAALKRILASTTLSALPFGKKFGMVTRETFAKGAHSPWRVAASVGLGVCMGIFPIWGYQMIAAFVIAGRLKLSRPLALIASNVSFPVLIPFVLYVSLVTGRLILHGHWDWSLTLGDDAWAAVSADLGAYFLGAVVLSFTAGAAVAALTYPVARVAWWLRSDPGDA